MEEPRCVAGGDGAEAVDGRGERPEGGLLGAHGGEQRLVGTPARRARLPVVVGEQVRRLVDPAVGAADGRPVVGGRGEAPGEELLEATELPREPPLSATWPSA